MAAVRSLTASGGTPGAHSLSRSCPLAYARRFYYDSLVFDRRALRFLVDPLGSDRLLIGSDFPAMPCEESAGRTLRTLGLPAAAVDDITRNNAFRWLGTTPAR